jgi:hypothetical protein
MLSPNAASGSLDADFPEQEVVGQSLLICRRRRHKQRRLARMFGCVAGVNLLFNCLADDFLFRHLSSYCNVAYIVYHVPVNEMLSSANPDL